MKNLGKAKTIKELRELIEKAILEYGHDALWYGFDDGSITITTNDQHNDLARIDCE